MKLNKNKNILLLLPLVMLSSCGSSDTTVPIVNSFGVEKETYQLNSNVEFNIDAQDNITSSENLAYSIEITLPDNTTTTISEKTYRVTQEGNYKASLTVTDEAGNASGAKEINFSVIDLYSGWSDNEANYFNVLFGIDLPRTNLFNDNYDVYQIFDFNYQSAPGVRFEFTSFDQNLLDEYVSSITADDYNENIYEEVFQKYMTSELSYIKVYEKNLGANTYLMVMPYVIENTLNINFQLFDHVIGDSWDEDFINTVINPDFQDSILPLEITANQDEIVTYFTDYNWYFEGASMKGYLRGILYNLDQSDIVNYINTLLDFGYENSTQTDFLTTGTIGLVYANEQAQGRSLITISSAIDAEIPFYYMEVMCA